MITSSEVIEKEKKTTEKEQVQSEGNQLFCLDFCLLARPSSVGDVTRSLPAAPTEILKSPELPPSVPAGLVDFAY